MKNIIITGASGNLGAATVTRFLAAGYRVLVTVSPGNPMKDSSKGEVEQFECDLTDEKSVDAVVQKMVAKYPVIDAALLLVGGFAMGDIAATDGASMKKMYSLNFETAYYVARPVFQHMMGHGQGGRIVFIGARPALEAKAGKGMIAYGLSKSLLFKLSEYLNASGSSKNVVSAVIVPGTIDTPANRASMPMADFSSWATPDQIAEVMISFTSGKSVDVTNQVLKLY